MPASEEVLSNEELVERALAKRPDSAAALQELLERVRAKFLPFVLRRANAADSDDIIAAVTERIWERLAEYRPEEGGFEGWAFAIVRNSVVDYHRARMRHSKRASPLPETLESEIDVAEMVALRNEIQVALRALSPLDREILILLAVHGLSADEVRRVVARSGVKLTRSALYNRAHRAKQKVAAALSGD